MEGIDYGWAIILLEICGDIVEMRDMPEIFKNIYLYKWKSECSGDPEQ